MTSKAGLELAQKLLKYSIDSGGYDSLLQKVRLVAAGNGYLSAVMTVEKEHTNQNNTLHGGMSALLVDGLSTVALMTNPDTPPGVSVNMNMTYMKAAPMGKEILLKVTTDKVGKTLAFLTVDIVDKESGKLVVKGTHTKFLGGTKVPKIDE